MFGFKFSNDKFTAAAYSMKHNLNLFRVENLNFLFNDNCAIEIDGNLSKLGCLLIKNYSRDWGLHFQIYIYMPMMFALYFIIAIFHSETNSEKSINN